MRIPIALYIFLFQAPLSKIRINKDPLPAYRQLCWSPDGALLAVTTSNGQIDIFDSYGFMVYPIFSQKLPSREANHSVQHSYAGVFFSDIRVKSRDWIFELILVDYSGKINSFLLSPSGYQVRIKSQKTIRIFTQKGSEYCCYGSECSKTERSK